MKESRPNEGRVALIPEHVATLVGQNLDVFAEHQAGMLAGFTDEMYTQAGATVCPLHELVASLKTKTDTRLRPVVLLLI